MIPKAVLLSVETCLQFPPKRDAMRNVMNHLRWMVLASFFGVHLSALVGQTRDEMVREDRRKVTEDGFWIYNDLPKAFAEAEATGKPILVVLRCIPCHECVKLDDELVDKDPVIRPLLDQFVCARQVSTNGLDLSLFQYDTDQSFAVFMLNADGTIYGRFGTRSHRTEWYGDVSLPGMAKALQGALDLHQGYPANRHLVAGKRGEKPEVASPEQYPSLKDRFTESLDYSGDVAKSCIHCHQIGDAQKQFHWEKRQGIPEEVLFPYPHPKSIGLTLDPKERATVQQIEPKSIAERAGLKKGDQIELFGGQVPLSFADLQWVLHRTSPKGGSIPMKVSRSTGPVELALELDAGWRQSSDISWRVSTWGLRRMVTGGMVLVEADSERKSALGLGDREMALSVKSAGKYGAHAAARRAGFQVGDIIVSYDGKTTLNSEQQLIHYATTHLAPGRMITVKVRREQSEIALELPIQP